MKYQIKFLWFITVLLLLPSVASQSLELIQIQDFLIEDGSIREEIDITFANNDQDNFSLELPKAAYDIVVNNVSQNTNQIHISLNCTSCEISFDYSLDNVVTQTDNNFIFSRTLNFPLTPKLMSYSLIIPPGFVIDEDSSEPSIVPSGKLVTDGRNI